jgi:hypothetical protein
VAKILDNQAFFKGYMVLSCLMKDVKLLKRGRPRTNFWGGFLFCLPVSFVAGGVVESVFIAAFSCFKLPACRQVRLFF